AAAPEPLRLARPGPGTTPDADPDPDPDADPDPPAPPEPVPDAAPPPPAFCLEPDAPEVSFDALPSGLTIPVAPDAAPCTVVDVLSGPSTAWSAPPHPARSTVTAASRPYLLHFPKAFSMDQGLA